MFFAGPPSDYTLDVEVNLPDNLMVINLKNLLMNLSVPVILDSGLNITEINITTGNQPVYVHM